MNDDNNDRPSLSRSNSFTKNQSLSRRETEVFAEGRAEVSNSIV